MPDEDMQRKYYNKVTRAEEWRCRYCEKVYASSGGTGAPGRHLVDYHEILKESKRDIKAKNVQKSIVEAIAQAAANPQKRRRLNTESIEQDKLKAL